MAILCLGVYCAKFPIYTKNPILNCSTFNAPTPRDVTTLSPANIGIFIAIGDSITACFAAKGRNGLSSFDEYRGLSFSAGGDKDAVSLFSFVQRFSAKVQGASTGKHIVEIPGAPYFSADHFNVAQSNARSDDLQHQLDHLFKVVPKVDPTGTQWKLITLFIGADDVCRNCKMTTPVLIANYVKNVQNALSQLEAKLPNSFVAVIPIFNVSGVYRRMQGSTYCKLAHGIPWECGCILNSDNATRARMDVAAVGMSAALEAVVRQVQAKRNPKFTATFLPFTNGVQIVNLPPDFISNLDCFHPTVVAHQQLAVSTWNSLLTPSAQRTRQWKLGEPIQCPNAQSRLQV